MYTILDNLTVVAFLPVAMLTLCSISVAMAGPLLFGVDPAERQPLDRQDFTDHRR